MDCEFEASLHYTGRPYLIKEWLATELRPTQLSSGENGNVQWFFYSSNETQPIPTSSTKARASLLS